MSRIPVPLGAKDVPGILRLQSLAFGPDYLESKAAFVRKLDLGIESCYGIFERGELIAYSIAFPWVHQQPVPLDTDALTPDGPINCLYTHDISVHPEVQSTGLGHLLMNTALAYALHHGSEWLNGVAVQNSLSYWGRMGFLPQSGTANTYGPNDVPVAFPLVHPHNGFVVRSARAGDLPTLCRLASEHPSLGVRGGIRYDRHDELVDLFHTASWVIGVVEDTSGEIRGFGTAHRMSWHWTVLDTFFVDPSRRTSGAGTALWEWIRSMTRFWGSLLITTHPEVTDPQSTEFLLRRGWRKAEQSRWIEFSLRS